MCLTSIFRKVPLFPSLILMPFHHQEVKAKISAFQSKIFSITCCSILLQGLRQCYVSLWRIWKSVECLEVLEFNQVRGAPEYTRYNPLSIWLGVYFIFRYSISVGYRGWGDLPESLICFLSPTHPSPPLSPHRPRMNKCLNFSISGYSQWCSSIFS